jgi:phosphomannomutase
MLGAACSINITPSHNPSNYLGLKFNPSDGGPAGPEITNLFQDEANRLMGEGGMGASGESGEGARYEEIDTIELYIRYLEERGTLDLEKIRDFVRNGDCQVVIDHVHGATRGRPERLFNATPADILGTKIILLRTEDNYLFGGVAPEPSAKNMKGVEEILRESGARFKIGVIMDPDGDRIRFADHTIQIPMNYFGAMALHFLHVHKGLQGVAAKSVGTSNFVNAIAEKHGIPLKETPVGFKNFRPFMLPDSQERAIVAFEESDGISGYNHTLEKDALFGLLLAIEMVATTGKNLGKYLSDLMDEYGHYYPDRSGIEVARSLAGEELSKRLSVIGERYPEGSTIRIGNKSLKVAKLITVDGTKIVLEDGSWLMIRPSGTEPKVRFYIEARTVKEKEAIFKTAERLTREAIEGA